MRTVQIKKEALDKRTREVGPKQARRLLVLDAVEDSLSLIEMEAGTQVMTEKKDKNGKTVIDKDGDPILFTRLGNDGEPIYKDIEMTAVEYQLYLCVSSIVKLLKAEWDYGK